MNTLLIVIIVVFVVALYLNHKSDELTDQRKQEKEERDAKQAEKEKQKDARKQYLLDEVEHQAELVNDGKTLDAIENCTYSGPLPNDYGDIFTSIYPDLLLIIPIAGMGYRGNLSAYEGDFNGVLVPEPTNDYDPNAIMVKCEDGRHLGYIPENRTADVRNLLGADFKRHRITGEIIDLGDDDDHFFRGRVYIAK